MKKFCFALIGCLCFTSFASAESNVAYQDETVRFTVINNATVRMEYAPDGKFVDEKSQLAVVRDYLKSDFKVSTGKTIRITTSKIQLSYKKGSGAFAADNMSITGVRGAFSFKWHPGMQQQHNLKGTYRTLDRCNGSILDPKDNGGVELPIEDGILARDGWTLIDDSNSYLFDGAKDWDWVKPRESAQGAQDWYFMAYGNDYKQALQSYAMFAGNIPLPPRYTFGYWWSRYWAYSDQELRDLVTNMENYQIPIDVLVVDMDWHYTDGRRGAWTGFSWNEALFPDPSRFLNYLRDKGLKITLNLHPADGIKNFEVAYPDIARDMGMDPEKREDIPWYGSDKRLMTSLFKHVLNPMEKEGVTFWWLDWQQYPNDLLLKDLSNTWWINYTFFSQMEKFTGKRPMLYHRWGGLGNHRYQIGFSGDTYITWASLDYQPYFNSTASNVLYGFWSHDIGGHMLDGLEQTGEALDHIDPELYVRWMQFGALSPVLRTHSTKDKRLAKEPWTFEPKIIDIIRQTVHQRYRMAPYIYTMARAAHDSSISLCRPMYYDYPDCEEAYSFRNQYMFGDNVMVAPITTPAVDGYSTLSVWLPEGEWYEVSTGTLLEGGRVVERSFALDEYPMYVKAGSVLPFTGANVRNLNANDDPIAINVFPGEGGSFTMYEDAGTSKDYETACAWTNITSVRSGHSLVVDIAPRRGSYEGMPHSRDFSLRVLCSDIPTAVKVNGVDAPYSYDPEEYAVVIELPDTDCSASTTVEVDYADDARCLANGLIARTRRAERTVEDYKAIRNAGRVFDDRLGRFATLNVAIGYHPERLHEYVDYFEQTYSTLPDVLKQFGDTPADKADAEWFLREIGFDR